MPPLTFPSEVRSLIGELSDAIPPPLRPKFFERVLAILAGDEVLSLGKVSAACQKIQIEMRIAPAIAEPATMRPTRKQTARGPFRQRA